MIEPLYALVVDDETSVRRLTVRALTDCDFECDEAADGEQAADLLARRDYHVVITDLRMPKRNGHSLAVQLLDNATHRPLVVVLTGVLEPRLAADLVARGVDDITFKPVNFSAFGAKIRAMCIRRQQQARTPSQNIGNSGSVSPVPLQTTAITMAQLEQGLDALAGALPVSPAASELVELVERGSPSSEIVTKFLVRDPLLTIEVLRQSNGAGPRPAGKRIDDLQQAVAWLGDRQVSEIATTSTTTHALLKNCLASMNSDLPWRRSLAAGLIIEQLHPLAAVGADDEALFLSSLVLPMSRVLMALAFPDVYRELIMECQKSGDSLASAENRALPLAPARAIAGLLARWNISPRLVKPLLQAGRSYQELSTATEPLRSKVEMLRVAVLLGEFAVGEFEPWDEIDFPPPETMRRLREHDLGQIIEQARTDVVELIRQPIHQQDSFAPSEVRYFKLGAEPHDLLANLLDAQGISTVRVTRETACQAKPALINCLDVFPERLERFMEEAIPDTGRVLVCNAPFTTHADPWGPIVQLPCSFGALADALAIAASGVHS